MAELGQSERSFGLVADALEETGVEGVFIGAIAAIAWGRIRTTTDVDLVIPASARALDSMTRALAPRGFTVGAPVQADPTDGAPDISVFWSREVPSVRVDMFHAKTTFEQEVIKTSQEAEVGGRRIRVARPEAVIIYKALAGRPKDEGDLAAVFEASVALRRGLDWAQIDRWAEDWGITARLAPWRAKYESRTR